MAERLEIIITGDASSLTGATKQASGALGGLADIAKGAAVVALGVVLPQAIGALMGSMRGLVAEAAGSAGVRSAFDALTEGNDAMLASMQAASMGLVSQTDLMKNFNLAAQLVSKDFAESLPDAMGYLAQVSASTGQSMDYLMESLVRGVGRLSPMILDNLAVQVDLNAAYQAYSREIGVSVDAMSKQQQQMAVMAAVTQQLATNTAAMGDATRSPIMAWRQMQTIIHDFALDAVSALVDLAGPALNFFAGLVRSTMNALRPALDAGRDAVRQLTEAFDTPEMREALAELQQVFGDLVGDILPRFTRLSQAAIRAFARAWEEHGPSIVRIITGILQGLDRLITLGDQLGGVVRLLGQAAGAAHNIGGGIGGVRGYATGGTIPPGGMGIVGERGPELAINGPGGLQIVPMSQVNSQDFNNYGMISNQFVVPNSATYSSLLRQSRNAAGIG